MSAGTARELSVRTRSAGGPVAPEVRERPPPFLQGTSRVVSLVHGYNNTEAAARASYATFGSRLADIYERGESIVPHWLARFHWPGETRLGPLSFVSYRPRPTRDPARRHAGDPGDRPAPADPPLDGRLGAALRIPDWADGRGRGVLARSAGAVRPPAGDRRRAGARERPEPRGLLVEPALHLPRRDATRARRCQRGSKGSSDHRAPGPGTGDGFPPANWQRITYRRHPERAGRLSPSGPGLPPVQVSRPVAGVPVARRSDLTGGLTASVGWT